MHSVDPVPTLVAIAPPLPCTATIAQSVSGNSHGAAVEFPEAPNQVVTIKSNTTEMLLALGFGDGIVGIAYPDGPPPKCAIEISVLADHLPSRKAVLALEPDLVNVGQESSFSVDSAGERVLHETLIRRSEEPRPAVEAILRLATTVNSSLESDR
jgi:iron complex transport system substrate-binding protein